MAAGGLVKGLGKIADELETAFSGAAKADTPKPNVMDEIEASFGLKNEPPLPVPDVAEIQLDDFLAELDQIGKNPEEAKTKQTMDELMAELDELLGPEDQIESPINQAQALMDDDPLIDETDEIFSKTFAELEAEASGSYFKTKEQVLADAKAMEEALKGEPLGPINYTTDDPGSDLTFQFTGLHNQDLTYQEVVDNFDEDTLKGIQILKGTGAMTYDQLEMAIHAQLKNNKGMPLTEIEEAHMDILYNNMEYLDLEKGNFKNVENIDLDAEFISSTNPNVPSHITLESITKNRHPDWVEDLDEMDRRAALLMTHLRGPTFLHKQDDLIMRNYENPEFPALFPSKEEFQQIQPHDITNVNFYTKAGDGPMNEALRLGKVDPNSDLGHQIANTQNSLKKLPSWDGGMVYRRVGRVMDESLQDAYGQLKPGDEFTESGFTSTTHEAMIGADENGEITFNGSSQGYYMVIKPKDQGSRAHGIEGLSEFREEREVLFEHGTKFRVKAIEQKKDELFTNAIVLFVEEI